MFGLAHRAQGPQTLMFMLETSYFYNLSELATSIGLCGRYGLENIKQTFLSYLVSTWGKNIDML